VRVLLYIEKEMTFVWSSKNEFVQHDGCMKSIQSVAAPLLIRQSPQRLWLFTEPCRGTIEAYSCYEGFMWMRQHTLPIQSVDTPGGAASSDGKSMLLVYRGYWKHHFLWYMWTGDMWYGNKTISVEGSVPRGNGRGPAVAFFSGSYWVFYVNKDSHLCSFRFEEMDQMTNGPLWTQHSVYRPTHVMEGRPCVVVDSPTRLSVCVTCTDCVAFLILSSTGSCKRYYIKTPGIIGSPCLSPYLVYRTRHLFFRDRRGRLCWWMQQTDGNWSRASCVDDIHTAHAPACYASMGRIILLCSTEPAVWKELDWYSGVDGRVLRASVLEFKRS